MKVLVVGHAYLAQINRKKWEAYAQAFPQDEVMVVTPSFWNDALFDVAAQEDAPEVDRVTYRHLTVNGAGNEVLYRYAWRDVWRVTKAYQPDVLLVEQGVSAFSYFQWTCVSLLLNPLVPRIFFTWINWRHSWGWKFKYLWWPIEWFNRFFSTAAIVGNPEAEKLLREDGFTAPVLVSPQLGIEMDSAETALSHEKPKRIGFVGRLTPEKGVMSLLFAFAKVISAFPDWELWIVGSGAQREDLEILARDLGVARKVVFTGSVNHEKALELLASFEILVLPSLDVATWKEQFGHVLIEAMAAGVVVVGSDAGAIPWVIGDAGLIFSQNCIDELAGVLSRLLHSDVERAFYAQKGKLRVEKMYTHECIARTIGSVLHERVSQMRARA